MTPKNCSGGRIAQKGGKNQNLGSFNPLISPAIVPAFCGSGGMADTPDLGSGAERLGGSTPPSRIPFNIRRQ